jgi:hypothetical protein
MSINNNPGTVTDGLLMCYDANNVKSYVGPPLQNLLTQIAPAGIGVNTGYVATTGSETVNIPTLGDTFVNYVTIQNNYTAFTPNSADCCPRLFNYGTGTLLPSTLYTYAIVYKCESGYTHPNFMYQYDYNGGTYVTEFGLHSTGQRTHLGGGWYWAWATFTTGATVNTLQSTGCFYYQYSTGVDKLTVAMAMMVKGDYTALHPRYWPALNTTRSTSFLDQTNNYTFTPSNISYSNAGVPSFSESASSTIATNMPIGNTLPALSSFTLEAWVKVTAWPTNTTLNAYSQRDKAGSIVGGCYYAGTGIRWAGNASGNGMTVFGFVRGADSYRNTATYTVPALNVYNHFVFTNNSTAGGMNLYVNGVLYSTVSAATQQYDPTLVSGCGNLTINKADIDGGGTSVYSYLNGNIDVVRVYNRGLTSGEVQRNYNALRGRFGL